MKSIIENTDCMYGMSKYSDKFFDLAIIDPPYGIGEGGDKNKTRCCLAVSKTYKDYGDEKCPDPEYFAELFRVSKNQIIFGANHFISKIPYDSPAWLIWDKVNGETDFADCELAWTSFKTAARLFTYRWQGMLQGNMKNKEKRIHPNQKPLPLYRWILKNYAKTGDKILDTHGGSMRSVIACLEYGYPIACFEKDAHYYNQAKKDINNYLSQADMFNSPEIQFTN